MLKSLLEEEGIRAWVVNDAMQIAGGELPLGWTAAAQVVVSDEHAVAAREFAEHFDHQAAEHSTETVAEVSGLTHWSEWPTCIQCGARRSARCAVCGASGNDFMLADAQSEPTTSSVLLKCEDCDDVFAPDWYRVCPQCGYDFGSGIEVGECARQKAHLNVATVGVTAGLAVLGGAFIAYFFWLFS